MFEKEAKKRARDFTENKERQVAYECGFLDGTGRMKEEMQKQGLALQSDMDKTIEQNCVLKKRIEKMKNLEEDNADLKQSLDWANEREKENIERITTLEEEKCELLGIIQDKDKAIKELEEKISVLLSCKNCPENKGGYICQKEYEDKCLAQKIQYIKELSEEKKLKVSDLKLGDTVRHKSGNLEYLVTGIDHSENEVFFGDDWSDDENLGKYWEKVEK